MKKILMSIIVLSMLAMSAMCFASDASSATPTVEATAVAATATVALPSVSASGDVSEIVSIGSYIVKNYKQLGTLGVISCILVLLLSILNSGIVASISYVQKYKRLATVVLGQALGMTTMVYMGHSWASAIVEGFLVSGGAMLIYDCMKGCGIIKSKKTA